MVRILARRRRSLASIGSLQMTAGRELRSVKLAAFWREAPSLFMIFRFDSID